MPAETPWQRRVRRLLMLTGTATTAYLFMSYLVGRMRDSRVRALKERRQRETIKAHFTSLLSTISFTLYALLPTLQTQLFDAFPVETTSQLLQKRAASGSAPAAPATETLPSPETSEDPTPGSTPADSLLLVAPDPNTASGAGVGHDGPSGSGSSQSPPSAHDVVVPTAPGHERGTVAESVSSFAETESTEGSDLGATSAHGPGESWASEFTSRTRTDSDPHRTEDDLLTASTVSHPLSLPPTDTSSVIASPSSEGARLEPYQSPPALPVDTRTKKELWNDLKAESITRAIATAYLVPLLYLLTTSQLTILSRTRYLADVTASNAIQAEKEKEQRDRDALLPSGGLFGYFSIPAMGLSEYVERAPSLSSLPGASYIKSWLPWCKEENDPEDLVVVATSEALAAAEQQAEIDRAEAERLFLTYSWWLLHEGWTQIASRVHAAVVRHFGPMPLKRDLSAEEWDKMVREVRANVETYQDDQGKVQLYDFTPQMLPPTPLPPSLEPCPLPLNPAENGAYLVALLRQTEEHLRSADARLLIDRGVSAMLTGLSENLRSEVFGEMPRRRLADLLPELTRWGRGVWEGVPDSGIETLLALPEYEAFAALVFGDWAPRD